MSFRSSYKRCSVKKDVPKSRSSRPNSNLDSLRANFQRKKTIFIITQKQSHHHRRSSIQICFLKFPNILRKAAVSEHGDWSLFLINFLKIRLQSRCFPMNIAKFLRIPIICEWFLLVAEWFCLQTNAPLQNNIPFHWALSITPENIRKHLVFWCSQGIWEETSGM